MFRFASAVAIVGLMALGVYGGAMLLFPALTPALAGLGVASSVPAQINHQGVVLVEGHRFAGNGQFKFAIVDPDTGNNVWTNDGSNAAPPNQTGEPAAAVPLAVTNGVYSVALGAAPMAVIAPSIFADGNLVLRVWFNDGTHNWKQLSPDQPLASVPYAFCAESVSPGSIGSTELAAAAVGASNLAAGAVSSSKLASAAVNTSNLANGAVSAEKLASSIGVWNLSQGDLTYSAGKVGINTTPGAMLDVGGSVRINGGTTITKFQAGTATVGINSGTGTLVAIVTFPSAFTAIPKVIVTCRTQTGATYDDVFAATTKEISTTQFKVNVARLDIANSGWGQTLLLDWIACQTE